MELVGGFMVMMGIIGFFLAVVWLVMPLVLFAIKGKVDRMLVLLEGVEQRLAALESRQAAAAESAGAVAATPPPAAGAAGEPVEPTD